MAQTNFIIEHVNTGKIEEIKTDNLASLKQDLFAKYSSLKAEPCIFDKKEYHLAIFNYSQSKLPIYQIWV